MKKALKVFSLVVALAFAVTLFAGCGSSGDKKAEAPKEKKIVIGLSLPTQREERWVRDRDAMVAEAKKLGIDLEVQISDNDSAKQESQAENLITKGVQVLIVAPNDSKAAANIVEKAHAAKIPVISYDRLILGTDVDLYMSFDNEKVGELQGKWLTDHVKKGNLIVLSGDPGDNNATLFKKGAMQIIQPLVDKGDLKIVTDQPCKDWQPSEAMKHAEDALTANHNDIQGVLAPNDNTAGGVIQALAAQGLAGKVPITGQDSDLAAAQRIVQGTQGMTIFKDTRELGKAAIDAAVKMAKGEKPDANNKVNNGKMDVPSILLPPVAVDKSNIDKVLIDSGYLKKEDVYKK
ncbi:Hypothetical protein LUCI_2142 [Lucifera butyrica]|uniref:Periplasmic binding protein domain-containing protein n=1 Tax=Lucifera butyrica TaxID=1351585 RepID=A0A498R9F7_9FIRM|nr:substrate-binding domain-containing protein [Lucifera butyrica]VBB06902.1 Hypothetical protein LUCI_2142 [Lucifera butyrica]